MLAHRIAPLIENRGSLASAQRYMQDIGGCVRLWPFQESSGTTAVDATAGSDGTWAGSPTLGAVARLGRGVKLDGSTQYADTTADATKNLGAFTVLVMFRQDSLALKRLYVEQTNGGAGAASRLLMSIGATGLITWAVNPSSATDVLTTLTGGSTKVTPPGTWRLAACACDVANDLGYIWLDGNLDKTGAMDFVATAIENLDGDVAPMIGVNSTNAVGGRSGHFNGTFQFVAVFNRLLTANEHKEIARRCGF